MHKRYIQYFLLFLPPFYIQSQWSSHYLVEFSVLRFKLSKHPKVKNSLSSSLWWLKSQGSRLLKKWRSPLKMLKEILKSTMISCFVSLAWSAHCYILVTLQLRVIAPNGHEMCGISEFYWFQPRKPQPLNWLVQIYCFANSGKIRIWAMQAKYKTKSKTHGAYMSHGMVAILWTAIPCMFYGFFTKTVERKQPRISHNFREIVKIANAIQ